MRFSVLGPLEVEDDDGERHAIGSANQRAVLAMLLAGSGSVVSTDELVEGLWSDDPPPSALPTLRTYVSRLRKLVGDRLVGHEDGYSIRLAAGELDSIDFEADVSSGRCVAALERMRGRPFGDVSDLPIVRHEARRLEALAASARVGRLDEWLASGRDADVIAGAEGILVDDPQDERVWAALVRALSRSGRVAEALRTFQRAADALASAGLEPTALLRSAEAEALSDERHPAADRRRMPSGPLTSSIGRDAERDRLAELIAARRLVTIVGPGGVGKTRLAVEVGRTVADRHRLGARTVELARISEPEAIGPAVRRALDHPEADSSLVDGLGGTDALLILDNCEHLVDAVAAEVPGLLAGGTALRILATSREPLSIPGEQRWALAPLSTIGPDAPALRLFIDRAREVGVDVDVNDPQSRQIVSALDGLPLAIEMAAAKLATMGLADLAEALTDNVVFLTAGRRGLDDRHGALRSLLAWSEDLLPPQLKNVLTDFSIFAGPVSATDLHAALDEQTVDDPVDAICALVERSLVTLETTDDGHARYGSLETVRQFGRERLATSGRIDDVARRHARWFTAVAEQIEAMFDSPDEAAAVARLGECIDELRAAHRWSRVHDPLLAKRISHALFFPAFQGLRLEVFDWTLALAKTLDENVEVDVDATRIYGELANGMTLLGRFDEVRRWSERAISAAAASADARSSRAAYGALADTALYMGELEEAHRHGRTYDELARIGSSSIERAIAASTMTVPLGYLGRHDAALELLSVELESDASPSAHGWYAYSRGEVLLDADPHTALEELDRAIELADAVGNQFLSGVAHVSAATLRARSGDLDHAVDPLRRAIVQLMDRGNFTHLATTLRNTPTLFVRLEEWEVAAEVLGGVHAISLSPTFGDEAKRLTSAEVAARGHLGDMAYDRAHRRGRDRNLVETAQYVVTRLRDRTASRGSEPDTVELGGDESAAAAVDRRSGDVEEEAQITTEVGELSS